MVTPALRCGRVVAMAKVADFWPAPTTTCAGTEAYAGIELLRVTTAPPAGAAEVSVTVPVAGLPPVTLAGWTVSAASAAAGAASVVNVVVFVTPWYEADSVVRVWVTTAAVVMPNVAEFAPALTVALPGTETAGAALDRVTSAPPAGAAEVRVTVPVDGLPPTTVAGLALIERSAAVPALGCHPS